MRDSLKSAAGWLVPLAFLALPNCTFQVAGLPPYNVDRGPEPRSSAVFCDIRNKNAPLICANQDEITFGVPLNEAALALTSNRSSVIGLINDPAVKADVGCAGPVAAYFKCPFPDGCPVCLNCGTQIGASPAPYADPHAACVAECLDRNGDTPGQNPATPSTIAFCNDPANVRVSTNAASCVDNVCTSTGVQVEGFVDPRRQTEPVVWRDLVNADATGNTLTKNTPDVGAFDGGAASEQTFTRGDGYVEFTVGGPAGGRALGLSLGAPPDVDATTNDLGFALRISGTGLVFIQEAGVLLTGPMSGAFASSATGDRLRVTLTDNFNGNASVKYTLFPAGCMGCAGTVLRDAAGPAPYPFRVDASLRGTGTTLNDVRIVRIK